MIFSLTGLIQIIHPQFKLSCRHFQETPVGGIQDPFQILSLYKSLQVHTESADISGQPLIQVTDLLMLLQNLCAFFHFRHQTGIAFTVDTGIGAPLLPLFLPAFPHLFCLLQVLLQYFQIRFSLGSDLFLRRSITSLCLRLLRFMSIQFFLKQIRLFACILLCNSLPLFRGQTKGSHPCLIFLPAL